MKDVARLRRFHNLSLYLGLGITLTACSGGSGGASFAPDASLESQDAAPTSSTKLLMRTSFGDVSIELLAAEAPITSANFLRYVEEGFFDGKDGNGATHFHRVIKDFMVQGGGFTESGSAKSTHPPIDNEAAASGLSNERGTLSMARTSEPNSATSQFFINVVDNDFLDAAPGDSGYAVFGIVTVGMDVVDQIAAVATDGADQPTESVIIESITVTE